MAKGNEQDKNVANDAPEGSKKGRQPRRKQNGKPRQDTNAQQQGKGKERRQPANKERKQGADKQQEQPKSPRNKRNNRRKNNGRKNNNEPVKSSKYAITDGIDTEKKQGGLKSLIKKPLKWLRSLGKK